MWKKFVRRSSGKYTPPELFTNTDIWLENWEQLNVTGDVLWLLKDQADRKKPKLLPSAEEFEKAYFSMYDEYANLTGLHEKMDKWRELMIMRIEARVEVAKGHKHWKNFIDDYTRQIENLIKGGDSSVIEHRMIVQQAYGQAIRPRETTLREFLAITKLMEKQHKPRQDNGTDRE